MGTRALQSARLLSILLAVCLILLAGRLVAPGAQEPTPRRKGYTVTQEPGGVLGRAVALQSDGGIVLGGIGKRGAEDRLFKDPSGHDQFTLTLLRFTPDGRLDAAFNGGSVKTTVGEVSDVLRGVAVQSYGRIVGVARSTRAPTKDHALPQGFSLVRYTTAGQLDEAFGDGGKVFTQLSKFHLSQPTVLQLQADGRILVAGSTLTGHWWPVPVRAWDFAVVRYLPTGRLDATFGSGGKAVHAVGELLEPAAFAEDMAVQPDGKIVVVGAAAARNGVGIGLLRLNADGSRDRDFGSGGRVVTQWKNGNQAFSVAIQSDRKILVVAAGIVLRYLPDGSLDPTFGDAGIRPVAFGHHVVLQPDGKILLASLARLARYLPDWRLDPTFGRSGIATITVEQSFRPGAPVLQPDGRILLGGSSKVAGEARFTLARCNADGTLDRTFGDLE